MRACKPFFFLAVLALAACNESGSSSATVPAHPSTAAAWGMGDTLQLRSLDRAAAPQLASSADGTTIAIWEFNEFESWNGSSEVYKETRIHTSVYTPGSGWSTPVDLGDGRDPRLATNASGQGVAIWESGNSTDIMSSHYTPGVGWSTPTVAAANTDPGVQYSSYVALDAEGNAFALWEWSDQSGVSIYVSRYTNNGGWSAPEVLYVGNAHTFISVAGLAMNANGEAMVIWGQYNGNDYNYRLRANRFTPAGGWETATDIGVGSAPVVVLDAAGNAMALWEKYEGSGNSIQASRFSASNLVWSAAAAIQTDASHYNDELVAGVDAAGNVMVLWNYQGASRREIRGNRFRPDYGWGDRDFTLDANDTGDSSGVSLAVAPNGSALAGWQGRQNVDGTMYLQTSHYLPDTDWSIPLGINTNSSEVSMMTLDAKGKGTLVWVSLDGIAYSLLASRYE